jgi:hypothetical protein
MCLVEAHLCKHKEGYEVRTTSDNATSGLSTVHVTWGLLRAQVVKAKLEQAGIPVLLQYESIGLVYGITVDGLGEVHVLVPNEYADEARALIEEP